MEEVLSYDALRNDKAVPFDVEIHKGAILVHIAPLWIRQPKNQNQSIAHGVRDI